MNRDTDKRYEDFWRKEFINTLEFNPASMVVPDGVKMVMDTYFDVWKKEIDSEGQVYWYTLDENSDKEVWKIDFPWLPTDAITITIGDPQC